MSNNNYYYIKIFPGPRIKNNYKVSIYCNNINYSDQFNNDFENIIFNPIIIPKSYPLIYFEIINPNNNKYNIYYIPNNQGTFKINIDNDEIYVKVKFAFNVMTDLLNMPKINFLDTDNTYIYHKQIRSIIPEISNDKWNTFIKYISVAGINSQLRLTITKYMAYFLNSSFSTFLITDFIDKYNVNVNKYINFNGTKYDSFNDFFTRKLVNLPEINLNSNDFRSPCTSRITSYSNIDANKFITKIKGLDFSINKLLDTTENFNINTILICRLAIQDYHHFHMPLTGKLTNIKKVGSDYLLTERSQLSVLTENYREVYEFINNDFKFWIVPIGSLLVGSIKNTLEIDKTYYSGERIGNFELGGSTVVILSEKTINIDDDILYYSDLNIETYVKVGDIIGSMVTKNIVEFPTKYYIINKKPESYSSNIIFKMVGILLLLYLIMILVWNNKNNKFFTIKNNIKNI